MDESALNVGDRERHQQGDRARAVALVLLQLGDSGRLPGRASLPLCPGPGGEWQTVLDRQVQALRQVVWAQQLVCVASDRPQDEAACAEARRLDVAPMRGPAGDSLGQLVRVLRELKAPPEQVVVRVQSSAPLICPEVVSAAVEVLLSGRHDYVATDLGSGVLPPGMDVEATYARLLYDLDTQGQQSREAATLMLYRPPTRHRVHELSPGELGPALERSGRYYASFRLLLEGPEDHQLLRQVASLLSRQYEPWALHTLLRLLDLHPEWRGASLHVLQARPGLDDLFS